MQLYLIFFKIGYKAIFLSNKLIQPFDLLSQHNNFMLKVFYLHLDVTILCQWLFKLRISEPTVFYLIAIISQ